MNPLLSWEVACHRRSEAMQVTSVRQALHRRFFRRF